MKSRSGIRPSLILAACSTLLLSQIAAAGDEPRCDYDKYASLPSGDVDKCATIGATAHRLTAVVKHASRFSNACVVTPYFVDFSQSGPCKSSRRPFNKGDKFFVNDWGDKRTSDFRLTVVPALSNHASLPVLNFPLKVVELANKKVVALQSDPSPQGFIYVVRLAPFLDQNGALPKFFLLEVFDVDRAADQGECLKELPDQGVAAATCPTLSANFDVKSQADIDSALGTRQTGTGGGTEPPPK